MSRNLSKLIRNIIEALLAVFLFVFQKVPVVGPWRGLMIFPLAVYFTSIVWAFPEYVPQEFNLIFTSNKLLFGRLVLLLGLVIFISAFAQLVKGKGNLVTWGLYSIVRHPQYFGLIITSLGFSIMCIQYAGQHPEVLYIWLIQVIGYIMLSSYEENKLVKKYGNKYRAYIEESAFIYPIPKFAKIPEQVMTLFFSFIIATLCLLL